MEMEDEMIDVTDSVSLLGGEALDMAYKLGFAQGRELLYQQMSTEAADRPAPRTEGAYLVAGAVIAVALGFTAASALLVREERKKFEDAAERAYAAARALDGL